MSNVKLFPDYMVDISFENLIIMANAFFFFLVISLFFHYLGTYSNLVYVDRNFKIHYVPFQK